VERAQIFYPVTGTARYPEIDILRGIALLMMVVFHTVFDLSYFGIRSIEVSAGFWRYFALATAFLFLLIAGLSLSISDARAAARTPDAAGRFLRTLKRGLFIFSLGLLVTFATWIFLGEGYVIFGILHLIGVSLILGWFFLRFGKWNILLGIVWITAGLAAVAQVRGPISLVWLGMYPAGFTSVDYTPLFPWFGVVLLGIGTGSLLYPGGKRFWKIPDFSNPAEKAVAFLGRHTLILYLVHQPVILLILQAVTGSRILF